MNKKITETLLCLGLITTVYFSASAFRTTYQEHKTEHPQVPTTSLENQICEKLLAKNQDCKTILLYDADSQLLFVVSSWGIIPVLTNQEFTEFKKIIYPELNFQEFREEKEETGSIVWHTNKVQKDLSIIYGFARDNAKTIIVNSEGDRQPNSFSFVMTWLV